MTNNPHGLLGNKNAVKKFQNKALSLIHVRCLTVHKLNWVKAAHASNLTLSGWITKTLNDAAPDK